MANYKISGITETTALSIVSLSEAKQYLKIDFSNDDQLIKDIIFAVINKITVDTHYPMLAISIREDFEKWPINTNNIITLSFNGEFGEEDNMVLNYFDSDNSLEELTLGTDYRLISYDGVLKVEMINTPNLYDRLDAIRFTYEVNPVGKNAETLRIAALMLIQHFYDNRSAVSYLRVDEMPLGYKNIINQYKTYIW